MSRSIRFFAAALVLSASAGVAQAQTSNDPSAGASTATAENEGLAQAQALVDQAAQAFAAKDYVGALNALQRAEPIAAAVRDPSLPQIRFNIARCFEQLGRYDDALAAYDRYNELPDESHRKRRAFEAVKRLRGRVFATVSVVCSPAGSLVEIAGVTKGAVSCPWRSDGVPPGAYAVKISHPGYETTIKTVEAIAGKSSSVEASLKSLAPLPQVVGVAPSKPINLWPWMTMGAGLVVGASGGFFTLSAIDNRRDAERLPPSSERDGLSDDFTFNRNLAYALYGTGAAMIVGGFVWWLLDEPEPDATAAIEIQPGPSGLQVRF